MIRGMTKTMIGILNQRTFLIAWKELGDGDAGEECYVYASEYRSVQFAGTFGSEGSVVLEGSNDCVNWFTLSDPQGNPISKMAPGIEAVTELTVFVRPRVQAGDESTNISAVLLIKEGL